MTTINYTAEQATEYIETNMIQKTIIEKASSFLDCSTYDLELYLEDGFDPLIKFWIPANHKNNRHGFAYKLFFRVYISETDGEVDYEFWFSGEKV